MDDNFLQKKIVQTPDGEIFYFLDQSFQDRPLVLLLHGLSANHTTWLNIIGFLRQHRYNSLALDLRGHGFSDKARKKSLYQLPVFSRDLEAIVQQENLKDFFLVGYSYGGCIALDYAIKHSLTLRGLVLMSTNHVTPLKYWKIGFLSPLAYGLLQFLAFILLWEKRKQYFYFEQGKTKGYWHSVLEGYSTMPFSINFWMLSQMAKINYRGLLDKIKAPTLIVRAKKDPFLTKQEAEDMAKAMPRAEILTPANASHFLASQAQEETSQILLNFFNQYADSDF